MPNLRDELKRRMRNRDNREQRRQLERDEQQEKSHKAQKPSRARALLDRFSKAINSEGNRKKLADTLNGLEDKIRGDGRSQTRSFFGNFVKSLRRKLGDDDSDVSKAIDEGIRKDPDRDKVLRSSDEIKDAIESIENIAKTNMRDLGDNLVTGRITTKQFRDEMQRQIRQSHALANMLGGGGMSNMSENSIDLQNRNVSEQMRYLDRFTKDIEDRIKRGESIDNVPNRAARYSDSIRPVAIESQRQRIVDDEGEVTLQERRKLNTTAEHCAECLKYERRGWVDVGSLPKIGQNSSCGSNCRCVFEYRKRPGAN